jgi:hypothetical protein
LRSGVRPYNHVIVPSYVTSERIQEQNSRTKILHVSEHEVELFRQILQEFHERELNRIISNMR